MEGAFGITASFPAKVQSLRQRYKLPLRGKTSPAPGEDVTVGDKRGNLASVARLRGLAPSQRELARRKPRLKEFTPPNTTYVQI